MIRCDICGCYDLKFLGRESKYGLIKCKGCLSIFTHPFPSEEEKKIFYGPSYYQGWDLTDSQQLQRFEAIKRLTFKKRLDLIETFKKPGRLLDVGTATGCFVEMALSRGWEAYGVEYSEYLAGIAKRKLGNIVFQGSFQEAQYKDNFFDVVTMLDVLEHLSHPGKDLANVHRILKAGGLLFITTLDAESLLFKILRSKWPHFNPVEHIYYFSRQGILKILKDAGFEVKVIKRGVKVLTLAYLFMVISSRREYQINLAKKLSAVPVLNFIKKIPQIFKLFDIPISVFTDEIMVVAQNNK